MNDKTTLHQWVDITLNSATRLTRDRPDRLTNEETKELREVGHHMVDNGWLRDDISEKWREIIPRLDMSMGDFYF